MFTFWTFFCAVQTFSTFNDFFFKIHFFNEFQNELKQWIFLQSIWFFVLVKADISYFTMTKHITQLHHISSNYLGFKCAFFQKILIFPKKYKKGAFKLSFGRMAKWTSYSKRTTHFWSRAILVCLCDSWNKLCKQMIKRTTRALECQRRRLWEASQNEERSKDDVLPSRLVGCDVR